MMAGTPLQPKGAYRREAVIANIRPWQSCGRGNHQRRPGCLTARRRSVIPSRLAKGAFEFPMHLGMTHNMTTICRMKSLTAAALVAFFVPVQSVLAEELKVFAIGAMAPLFRQLIPEFERVCSPCRPSGSCRSVIRFSQSIVSIPTERHSYALRAARLRSDRLVGHSSAVENTARNRSGAQCRNRQGAERRPGEGAAFAGRRRSGGRQPGAVCRPHPCGRPQMGGRDQGGQHPGRIILVAYQ